MLVECRQKCGIGLDVFQERLHRLITGERKRMPANPIGVARVRGGNIDRDAERIKQQCGAAPECRKQIGCWR